MKQIYKKWWFWLIIILILGGIGSTMKVEPETKYISKYEWNLNDTKTEEDSKYVVLSVENEDGDLESGEYTIKTNDNNKASFVIIITDKYYESIKEIPGTYDGMVQGFDNSEYTATLNKGNYLYLIQGTNGQGKVIVTKK